MIMPCDPVKENDSWFISAVKPEAEHTEEDEVVCGSNDA